MVRRLIVSMCMPARCLFGLAGNSILKPFLIVVVVPYKPSGLRAISVCAKVIATPVPTAVIGIKIIKFHYLIIDLENFYEVGKRQGRGV